MVRLRLALVCTVGVLLFVPEAAAGGGWWSSIHMDRSPVAPGQRVELQATVAFRSAAAAQAALKTDRVYLLRGFDDSVVERAMRKRSPGDWWSLGGAEAIEVGRVTVRLSAANFGRATAAFTVPELPPARYHLMLCDAGCREPFPDVVPAAGVTVVADPATARIARRLDRVARRSRSLAAGRAEADRALAAARSDVDHLAARLPPPAAERRTPWAYAGWLVAAALAAVLFLRPQRSSRDARARRRAARAHARR